MPQGVEHTRRAQESGPYVKGPMMPQGVEHILPDGSGVKGPMMPQGVEHRPVDFRLA